VLVDGVNLGHPAYNQYRSDIATLFPGLANSNGAVGFFYIDTTLLANGIHTISWVATDSAGHTDGLGSRYFNVLNNGGPIAEPEALLARPRAGRSRNSFEIQELEPIAIEVGTKQGYSLVNGGQRPLPIGSTIQGGVFYWQPGPGFLGEYELQFERPDMPRETIQIRIRPSVPAVTVQ
jgi:hypothetical protein